MITQHKRGARAVMPARAPAGAAIAVLVGLTLACGGGATVGPGSTSPPADADLTATASATSDTPPEGTIDLAERTPLSIIYGSGEGDLPSDQPALASGDFDGDGVIDLAIGARFADPSSAGTDAGSVYVIRGSPDLPAEVDLRGEQDLTITGPHPGAGLGFSTVAADLNGDGTDDLAIGAAFARTGAVDTGAVYVFFGPLPVDGSEITAASADVSIGGQSAAGFFGDSLAAGDVNADGIRDLIVGATFDRSHRSDAVRGGAVYVFSGRGDWPARLSAGDADVSIFGEDDLDELGDFVASGDVNGDGRDDIVATAEAADGPQNDRQNAAQVYVLFGREGFEGVHDVGSGDADVVIYGANAQDTLGFSLATGDLDGDGIADLAMGARLADGGGMARAGVVYVLPGGGLPSEIDLASPPDSVRAIHGASPGDLLGSIVHVADVTGDGRNELLAGARLASLPDRARAGAVYIVPGLPDAGMTSVAAAASYTIRGRLSDDALGGNIGAADLNADGHRELIVVAENAPGPGEGRPLSGRVYIISVP